MRSWAGCWALVAPAATKKPSAQTRQESSRGLTIPRKHAVRVRSRSEYWLRYLYLRSVRRLPTTQSLEQRRLLGGRAWRHVAEVAVGLRRRHTAARSALKKAVLH